MGFLFVALGGAIGAVGRYAISLIPIKTGFPVLTLITNILGAVLIGFIVGIVSDNSEVSPNTVLFWKTGVCGGFTTFSTFSLEAFTLFESKAYLSGGIYVLLSVVCCLVGIFCGKKLVVLMSKNSKICPNCGHKMKQQFIGLQHCRCGMSWKRDIGFFERTPDMVFALQRQKKGRKGNKTKQVPIIRYKE